MPNTAIIQQSGTALKYSRDENDSIFFQGLRKQVTEHFETNGVTRFATAVTLVKASLLLTSFILSYLFMFYYVQNGWITFLFGLFMGITSILIVFNISHDAAHHALFRNKRWNSAFALTFYLVGGNAYLWDQSHNKTHHTYPNVALTDPDIYQAAPFLRVNPADPWKPFHSYQHKYAPLVYLMHSFYLIFIKDFQDFRVLPPQPAGTDSRQHPAWAWAMLFFSKAGYIFYTLIIPVIFLPFAWWQILIAFIIIQLAMSVLLSLVLVPVHMMDGNSFPAANPHGQIGHSWVRSIFENTIDYSTKNRLVNFLFGGLNNHLAHHLFPDVCHEHLPRLTKIVEIAALEYNLPYRQVSMVAALRLHFNWLKKMSTPPL